MNESQRKILWTSLILLAIPAGFIVSASSRTHYFTAEDPVFWATTGAVLAAAIFIRAGRKEGSDPDWLTRLGGWWRRKFARRPDPGHPGLEDEEE